MLSHLSILYMCLISSFFREFSLLGLFIIGVGTGGIKPCVSAFGGEQFVRPQQDKQLEQFFSYFYISINAGSLLSTLLTPILREDVQCFGQNSCFPLAFGVPAVLMVVAIGKLCLIHLWNMPFIIILKLQFLFFLLNWWSCFLFWQMELQDAPYWRQYHGRRIEMHRRNNFNHHFFAQSSNEQVNFYIFLFFHSTPSGESSRTRRKNTTTG